MGSTLNLYRFQQRNNQIVSQSTIVSSRTLFRISEIFYCLVFVGKLEPLWVFQLSI